jgi:hypothetical protein
MCVNPSVNKIIFLYKIGYVWDSMEKIYKKKKLVINLYIIQYRITNSDKSSYGNIYKEINSIIYL